MVVVITGASSGVGRAVARAFGARGDQVCLIARGREGLEAAAREIQEAGGETLVLPLDVVDRVMLDAAADQAARYFGGIDVWVNSAMVGVLGPAGEMSDDEFRRVTEVNYLGAVWGTLAAVRHMRARNRGVVIQMGSALAYRSIPMQSAYCATKAAVRAFTDSLRSELLDEGLDGISLCHLALPAVNTPQFDVIRNKLGGHAQPMGTIYQPEVIADAAVRIAEHPVREMWLGPKISSVLVGQKLIPGLLDRLLARDARAAQVTAELPEPGHDNLMHPLKGDRGAHGSFDALARSSSLQLWARFNLKPLLATAAAFVGLAALWRLNRST